ncbi:MAG: type II 3-dehydroquinate dehydratase [Desulfobacteraceae bacterium]|nr:type II 3-dehydroquinate dehydratase [Desulfobacteraceae bacterium]MBC2755777.1 type II 3-dehydroquinate dehydratase [Desulfobacteraceae bacterium]
MKRKVLVIHGPNLNMLGKREPEKYGTSTLDEINTNLKTHGNETDIDVHTFQSNHEGSIVEKIQEARDVFDALIINPASYTHSSIAIRDAVLLLDIPVVEIHLSNIYKRESFRHKSILCDVVTGQIAGFGMYGYIMALDAIINIMKAKKSK